MAYNPVRDEIVVPQFFAFAILTFAGDADGNVAPLRKIFGPSTQLKLPQALAIDPIHEEIFVPQGERILVFPIDGDGDMAPKRILGGPDTGLNARRLTVDPLHDLLIASSRDAIRIFDRSAAGNTKPLRIITHEAAADAALMTSIPETGMIVAAVRPQGRYEALDYVGIWSVFDDGDVPPRWTVGGPGGLVKDTRGITVDPKNKNVIVSDKTLNAILTFHIPEAF